MSGYSPFIVQPMSLKKIKMVKTDFYGISIDTPQDLIRAEEYLKKQ